MRSFLAAATLVSLGLSSCGGGGSAAAPSPSGSPPAEGRADVGGYELAYECRGEGEPTVVLEAGLGAGGRSEFIGFIDRVASITRVCAYDRAGTGASEERPAGGPTVTAGLMADELQRLLEVLGVERPIVLVGHSYGGMPVRAFAGAHPDEVAGMVLIDVSSEPEVPVYERLDAGPWIDDTDRIDISTQRCASSGRRGIWVTPR
jgi:pimeloyl-ACP methyl ester carboxylesterase